jgi:predicted DCC family thiol-disulfide oxidoreductase YuxK
MIPDIPNGKILIQFDGICILCSRAVKLILEADRKKKFIFQALQHSDENQSFETIIVTDSQSTYEYFDAFLKIGKELGGIYKVVAIFKLLPRQWRHSLYLWVAKNRFRWFGKRKSCYLPSPEEKERFI